MQFHGKVENLTPPLAVPETPEPMVTKCGMDDDLGEPYPCANFYYDDPIRGLRSPRVQCVQSDSASYFFSVEGGAVLPLLQSQAPPPSSDFYD